MQIDALQIMISMLIGAVIGYLIRDNMKGNVFNVSATVEDAPRPYNKIIKFSRPVTWMKLTSKEINELTRNLMK